MAIGVEPRRMTYPPTAILSVDAVHERFICEDDIAVALNPTGVDGGIESETTLTPMVN